MDSRLAIRVRDVHVDFDVHTDRRAGLRSRLVNREASAKSTVHALRGVTFDVHEGETLGIIGLNGSGKSTLLAAIAGVLPVSRGQILVSDEPRLMGVGAAMFGEASGRRNIWLGCLALGMSKQEIASSIEDLVEFTELGDAIDRPLNTYSSGMRARVQFVVATAMQPRILMIDEALGVGDKNFRSKSNDRIGEIIRGAGTLLMVNHSLDELKRWCTRAVWLSDGRVVADGPIDEVVSAYSNS